MSLFLALSFKATVRYFNTKPCKHVKRMDKGHSALMSYTS